MNEPRLLPTDERAPGEYAAQEGTWTLTAPDGRKWEGCSPLHVARVELNERVPAGVQLARIKHEADTWCEGIIELKRDGDYLVVSVERNDKYVEVIREYEPGGAPIGHAVHPSGIDSKLKEAGLL